MLGGFWYWEDKIWLEDRELGEEMEEEVSWWVKFDRVGYRE